MTRLLTFAAFALLPALAWGEGYICAADMATGFAYRNGDWRQTEFKPVEKFVVRRSTQVERPGMSELWGIPDAKWTVVELGKETPAAGCSDDFKANGDLSCHGALRIEFRMNKNSLRFLYSYLGGYWDSTPGNESSESKDTPAIAIGKCSPM